MGNNFHFWVFQSANSDLTLISQPISSPVHALLRMKDNTIYFHFYICPENYNRLSAMTAYNILPTIITRCLSYITPIHYNIHHILFRELPEKVILKLPFFH